MVNNEIRKRSRITILDNVLVSQKYEEGLDFMTFSEFENFSVLENVFGNKWIDVVNITVEHDFEDGRIEIKSLFDCEVAVSKFGCSLKICFKTKVCNACLTALLCSEVKIVSTNNSGFKSKNDSSDENKLKIAHAGKLRATSISEKIQAHNCCINANHPLVPFVYCDGDFDVALTFIFMQVEIVITTKDLMHYNEFQEIFLRLLELLNIIIGETLNVEEIFFAGKYPIKRKLIWRYDHVKYMSPYRGSFADLQELSNFQNIYDAYKSLILNPKNKLTFDLFYAGQNEQGYSEMQLVHMLQAIEGLYNIKGTEEHKLKLKETTKDAIIENVFNVENEIIASALVKDLKNPETIDAFKKYLSNVLASFGNITFKEKLRAEIYLYGKEIFAVEDNENKINNLVKTLGALRDSFSHGYSIDRNSTLQLNDSDFKAYSLMLILMMKKKLIEMLGLKENSSAVSSYIKEIKRMFSI